MSGVTYEYESFDNVAGGPDLLSKLRSFAIAQGWTSVEYETDVDWADQGGGNYDWDPGTDDYLELLSDGYGNQSLRWRFGVVTAAGDTGDAADHWFTPRGAPLTGYAITTTSSKKPWLQKKWNTGASSDWFGRLVIPSANIHRVHFIGNDKLICCVIELNALSSWSFGFGTWELFPEFQDTDEGMREASGINWARMDSWQTFIGSQNWERSYTNFCFCDTYIVYQTTHCPWYMFGEAQSYLSGGQSVQMRNANYANDYEDLSGVGLRMRRAFCNNAFSNKRPMLQPALYLQNMEGDERLHCVGHEPHYYMEFTGLTVGQILENGADKYICFPCTDQWRKLGWAMKVNV